MAKDYATQLIMESRNNVHHNTDYTRKCRCWGECWEKYKEQTKNMDTQKFKRLFGAKELSVSSVEYENENREICKPCKHRGMGCRHKAVCLFEKPLKGVVTEVYYGPWKEFAVREDGMWTSISCPHCEYTNFWAAGDGDELF